MVLTTKEASYIIVLGIVISVLPISSTATWSQPDSENDCQPSVYNFLLRILGYVIVNLW